MLNFKINGKRGNFSLSLPTDLSEVSDKYLADVTRQVHIADNYVLVALIYQEALPIVLNTIRKKQELTTKGVARFVRSGNSDSSFINNIPVGCNLVVTGTSLARGIHITSPANKLTVANIVSICDGDNDFGRQVFTIKQPVCFVEFKLIPACDVNGYYKTEEVYAEIDPYIIQLAPNATGTLN